MSRTEITGVRDLTFSRWHRTLSDDFTYIDLDYVAYCRRCRSPLALIEMSTDPNKTFTVTRKLAEAAGIQAWLLIYTKENETIGSIRMRPISPALGDMADVGRTGFMSWRRRLTDSCKCRQAVAS